MVDLSKVPPYSIAYFENVGKQNPIAMMHENLDFFKKFYVQIPSEKWNYAYDSGKWTVKEVLGHIIECERIFSIVHCGFPEMMPRIYRDLTKICTWRRPIRTNVVQNH